MKKKLAIAGITAGLLFGGTTAAIAGPYKSDDATTPGNSGDNSLWGLCNAYSHNNENAKKNSAVFSGHTADEWADICEGVTRPGGGQ